MCWGSGAMVTEQDHSVARDAKMKPLSGPSEAHRTKEHHIDTYRPIVVGLASGAPCMSIGQSDDYY